MITVRVWPLEIAHGVRRRGNVFMSLTVAPGTRLAVDSRPSRRGSLATELAGICSQISVYVSLLECRYCRVM